MCTCVSTCTLCKNFLVLVYLLMACSLLFVLLHSTRECHSVLRSHSSYVEIYNEKVKVERVQERANMI